MIRKTMVWTLALAWSLTATAAPRFDVADLDRLAEVAEPAISPDGRQVAYTVTTANVEEDRPQSDLWRVNWDGSGARALTATPTDNEWLPRWSPDGAWLAFLSDRGGEARVLTAFPGGVEDYVFSPDGRRLAVIANDPERPAGQAKPKQPPPIVIDRYYFKEDGIGYLTNRRRHLYVFDLATGRADLLTPGDHDEYTPSWAPDGSQIAYVTKRGGDPDRHINFDIYLVAPVPGSPERQLTSFVGADLDPYWESRPAWSPDGRRITYLQGGEDRWVYYSPWQVAVVDVATGKTTLPAPIDLCMTHPRFSADGKSVLALVERSRVTWLSRIDLASGKVTSLTSGRRFEYDFDLAPDGRIAVLGGDDHHPYEVAAVERTGLRPLTDHNGFLRERELAPVEPIEFASADGTRIDGFLVKPPDYVAGRRYPTILRLHGGPFYQFSHEFMADWQAYAAHGYVVIAVNPRGGSGRGFDFGRAIYADWGNKDVQDVLAAVDWAVGAGIADPDRLGVGGRSYGSILTNYVIASDQRFKAAVSGSGASNPLGSYGFDQYTREYELELGTPWENRELYEKLGYPFLHADRITTPTLFYCAEKDFNVPCHGSEQMYQALRSRGVPTRLIIYPGEYHPITVPSYLRDRMARALEWYDRYLKPAGEAAP
jgi:dipeptidyl aminopeptidase/acylaminoacyl peptidase